MIPSYSIDIFPRLFHFKKPAGTSRGVYTERRSWYVRVASAAPLPQLSVDDLPDYEGVLRGICAEVARTGQVDTERWREYPSMLFGLETALRHLERGTYALWDTPFSRGEEGICINGLIWMVSSVGIFRLARWNSGWMPTGLLLLRKPWTS